MSSAHYQLNIHSRHVHYRQQLYYVQTCYAKQLSICSGYCEFNALVHVHCVEWNCYYYFFYLSYSCLYVLFACATILYGE